MATNASGEFETALKRLEDIVKILETGDVELDASVALFKEGKQLQARCEALLNAARESIVAAASDGAPAANGNAG